MCIYNKINLHSGQILKRITGAFFSFRIEISIYLKGEPELTDPFNLLINEKLRVL